MPFSTNPVAVKKRTKMAFVTETGYAEDPPNPTPTLQDLLETNDTFKSNPEYTTSNNRRSDRNVPGSFLSGLDVSGTLGTQLIFNHYDPLWQALLFSGAFSAEAAVVSAQTTIAFESISTSASDYAKITDSGNGLATAVVGSTITPSGAATADNNKPLKVKSVAAGEIEVYGDLTDESAGATVTLNTAGEIRNGTTANSFYFERNYEDQGANEGKFAHFFGMIANEAEMTIAPRQLITVNYNMQGSSERSTSATLGDGSNTAAPTDTSMNAVQHVGDIVIGDNGEFCVRQVTLRMSNGLEALEKVGRLGPFDYAEDDFVVSGEIQIYYDTNQVNSASPATEFAKALAGTKSSLYIPVTDAAGNIMVFDIPKVQWQDADRAPGDSTVGGVILTLPFQAEVITEGSNTLTMRIARDAA